MRVEITAAAEADLASIADHIAVEDPPGALEFVGQLRSACAGLGNFPERFALVRRYERLGIRHRVCGNYLLFYRVEDVRVVVLRVLHGARDYQHLLGDST